LPGFPSYIFILISSPRNRADAANGGRRDILAADILKGELFTSSYIDIMNEDRERLDPVHFVEAVRSRGLP
jgi:hypothetical protein